MMKNKGGWGRAEFWCAVDFVKRVPLLFELAVRSTVWCPIHTRVVTRKSLKPIFKSWNKLEDIHNSLKKLSAECLSSHNVNDSILLQIYAVAFCSLLCNELSNHVKSKSRLPHWNIFNIKYDPKHFLSTVLQAMSRGFAWSRGDSYFYSLLRTLGTIVHCVLVRQHPL